MSIENDSQKGNNDRLLLGCSSLFFRPLSAFIIGVQWEGQKANDPTERLLLVLLESVAFASLLFFLAGLLWAVSGIPLLKKVLDSIAIKIAWTIIPFVLLTVLLTVMAVIKG